MTRALGWAALLTTAIVVLCWPLACGTFPPPVPTPPVADAGPSDVFTGQIFDCHAVPLGERGDALAPVDGCLASGYTAECLVDLTIKYPFALPTVACLARDLGASANASVLAGDPTQQSKADNARAWIASHALGYK
jgi:hypothetical protein